MADIWSDPVKRVMLIILMILEIPSFVFLVYQWFKAKKEYKDG